MPSKIPFGGLFQSGFLVCKVGSAVRPLATTTCHHHHHHHPPPPPSTTTMTGTPGQQLTGAQRTLASVQTDLVKTGRMLKLSIKKRDELQNKLDNLSENKKPLLYAQVGAAYKTVEQLQKSATDLQEKMDDAVHKVQLLQIEVDLSNETDAEKMQEKSAVNAARLATQESNAAAALREIADLTKDVPSS